MDEQVLKDLIATAEASNYNWEEVMPKFPELADVDLQVLKDYVETAKHYDYDYDVVNAKFPELGLKKKDESEPTVQEDVMESTTQVVEEQPILSESSAPQEGDQSVFDAKVEEAPETVTEFAAYDPREESGTPESMAQGIVTSATNPMLRTFVDPTDRTNVTYDADATTFERSLAFITPDLIGREEEEVVNRMKYHFTDYGFTFSQTGIGDAMIVKADNGEEIEIDLDPFTRGGEEQGSIELQNFLQQNRRVDPEMEELTYSYDLNRKKYFSRQAVDNDIQSVRAQSEALGLRYQDYLREQGEIDTAITAMTQVPLSERGPEFKAEYDALIQKKSELAGVKGQLQQEVGEFQIYSDKINSAVGNYLTMKEDDSSAGLTFLKAGWNNILSGITGPLASAAGIPMDLFYGVAQTVDEDFGMTEEEKKERYITIATDLGYDIPENIEDDAVYNKWLEGLMESTFEAEGVEGEGISATMNRYPKEIREELEAEGYDPSRVINADGLKMWNNEGGILGNGGWEEIPDYASDTSPGERLKRLVMDQEVKENKEPTKQLVRSLLDIAKFEDVSEERVQAQSEESIIVEGLLGLAQSAPSIALGFIGRGKGPKFKGAEKPLAKFVQSFKNYATSPGAVAQTIGFSLLQTDALMQEMENDPDFKYVTETEKKAITVPLAVSTAILETYGLRSIVANKTLMGGLMRQVTKLLPKGATPKMFSETFKKVVESNIAKGVYSSKALRGVGIVGAAATVEAETGGLQTVAEIGMKNVWNDMYEKEMFNTPEMWSEEFNNQVIRGALAEAVGGFVMGTPRALTTAFNKGDIDEVSDDMVALFNEIRKDGTTVEAYKTQLDLKVANQEMTKEEANQNLLDFEVLSGAAASIEKGTELTPTQTKKALGLVYLKNKLESEMDGMDPDLGSYKAKQEMLVTIKEKLSKIGTEEEVDANLKPKKDAVQESSTTEVDVQKQAQDGKTVGKRDAEGGVAVEGESETEVSPETTEEKVELTVEERAKQIEELVEQEQEDSKPLEPQPIPREQLESVDETVSINKKNAPKRVNPLLDTVKRRVNRAAKAIKRIAPNVKIILHESAEDFTAATGSRGRGTFLDNTIHINLEDASGTTVAHEAFHAILLSKISTDLQAQQVTKRLMQSMAKSLDANSPLKKKIEEFVEGYDENIKNEERLAQVLGELSSNYTQLKAPEKSLVRRWIDKLSKRLGYEVSEFTQEDQDVVDLLNTLAAKVTAGVEVEEGDVEILETEQGDGGEVGTLKVREQKDSRNSPKVETDKRSFAKFISNKDLGDFDGRDFVTNMYDFTTAGVVDIGNGITLDLQGGKSYVPFMMEKQGLNIGDVSNLAAFNTKAQAESFIRNSEQGNAKLFIPHAGTIEKSWQFQQSIFEQLMNAALDNKILSKKDIINSFNEVLTNEVGKKAFAIFKKKLGKNIRNFNSFSKNPLEIVELLNTTNNFSPELRKALNDKLSANKKYQAAIGVKSKEAFARKMEDPLNKGVEGGDLMGVVEFDNTNFEISKPKPGDADYHPSFAWTVKAKIEGIYQPTKFYKSYDVTDEYTKYNQSGPNVSRKAEQTKEQFIKTNVMSSPGSIPKVAKVSKREQIIGQNANLSQDIRDNLGVARAMADNNNSAKDIRLATGWEIGVDKKWRYEIPNVKLKDTITKEFISQLPKNSNGDPTIKLRDLVDANELMGSYDFKSGKFKAIGDIDVSFSEEGGAQYEAISQDISISITSINGVAENKVSLVEDILPESFLAHEIQHAIQHREGFAFGGNSDMFSNESEINRLEQKLHDIQTKYQLSTSNNPEGSKIYDKVFQKLRKEFTKYNRLAGEVESRNIQKRMRLTSEEKKLMTLESTEDIAREDQIIFFPDEVIGMISKSQPKVAKVAKREQKAAPSYSDDLMYQYDQYTDKNGELDVDLVLEKIDEDIASLKNKDLIEEKLRAFEELIIPAISGDITSPALTQFEADVLMDPNATAESIERGFRKAKNIIDKEGSIDFSKTKESDLFKGGEINLPAFERFVDKNPEYQGVFNDWEKLFTESTEALLKDLNAFNVVDIKLAESFKKQLQETGIKSAPREQLGIKEARKFKMNRKGFIPKYVDMAQLQKLGRKYGLTLVKDYKEFTRDLTGYHFEDAKGQFYNPFLGQRFQKIADKFQDPVEIIKLARTAGFEDSEIKYFLQKTWKGKKKLKVKEINDLLKVDVDMFASMPAVFGNVPGGMVAGRKLYEATMKKFNSLLKKNLKRPKDKQASMADMINESIEFMMGRKAYKEATEGVKSKTELSTLQQQLQASMQEALGGGKVKDISKKIKELKKIVRQKIRGAREVRDVKRQLQRTIREVLPKAAFNKTEVRNLLRTIQDAEPKWLKGNLRNLTEKIESLAAEKNVSILNKAIQKILDNKFLVKVGGLEKLIKIDQATYKIVESIKDKMYKAAEVKDDIIKEQTKLIEQVEGLNRKLELTEEEETELLVLNISLGINNAKLMEDSNPRKADQLAEVYNNLKDLITQGRNNYKEAAKERSKRYAKNTALFHQALEGYKDVLDFTDPEVLERIRKDLKKRGDEKGSDYGRNALKEYFKKIGANIDKYLKMGTLGLSQLSSALDKSPGAAFEGFIKDFVYRKVNESTRMYKESMMALDQILTEKTEEYLGKDYAKKIKEYRKSIDFLELKDGKFFKDPQEVKDAKKEFDKDPTRKNQEKLNKIIRENIPFSNLTPLQLQYLYFQYKQKDTHAGFKTSLGDNYESIMDGLSKHFEETYPDLLELGRWQVEVMLPSLYEKYNEVYKKLYNTDLPQRDNYSGRTFRVISKGDKVEMEKYDPLSLLSEKGMPQMGMNVIGNSTKLTQKNDKAIMPVDAFTAIDTYLKDMEHFAAYAENINEISKVFFNKDIVDTIVSIHGKDVYDTIRKQLMATAQRGANQSDKTVELVNRANNIFIVQKLGAGLTVYLKQLTSIGTYGNFIGYGNWIKTATTMGPKEFIKAAKEISEESVYIKYRYWQQISKTIEAYGEKQMETYTPGDKGNKVLRLLMSPIKAGDKQAIYLGGIPNYVFLKNKFMKQGMSEENAKKKAMLMFEEQTKEVQQSDDKQDKDSIQNEGGLVQTFNMFMSAPKAYLRQIFGGYRELGRNIKDGSGKGTTGENLRTILVYQFAMPMIFQWAGSGFPVTDWDDEDKKDMARAAILSVFNSIFVLGQILEMVGEYATGKTYWDEMKQFPVLDLVKDAIKQYDKTNLEDSEKADEAWKQFIFTLMPLASVVPGGGTVAALPFKTLDRMRLNMKKIIQDGGDPKEVFLRLFNYSDYVIEGPEEKEKKPKKLRKSEVDKYMPELSEQMEEFNNDPDYKEMLKDIKDLKKEQEAMRQELLEEMFAD